jgi:hypothetical protein
VRRLSGARPEGARSAPGAVSPGGVRLGTVGLRAPSAGHPADIPRSGGGRALPLLVLLAALDQPACVVVPIVQPPVVVDEAGGSKCVP